MITAKIILDEHGVVSRFEAEGHAFFARSGGDIVCSAFSVLARSAYESLAALPGAALDAQAQERGSFGFRLTELPSASTERAGGITDCLLLGLYGLERDYPGSVRLAVER
ncbi:MAG: ribosomal-processing cysteine protease Prp [Rectinemataceae bacterium]